VEILFQSHHADVSDWTRDRARRAVEKLAQRLGRVVDAVIRFEQDGPMRRVEILLHTARRKNMVAEGTGRYYGPALVVAIARIEAQARQLKRTPKSRVKKLVRV
jgi:ribosome-associated translation inhibitor RaiA